MVEVAPPQAPVGAELVALYISPVVTVQVEEDVKFTAEAQASLAGWAKEITENPQVNRRIKMHVR